MAKARGSDGWRRLITAFVESKDFVGQFCARRTINERTFRWWRWKLASEASNPGVPVTARPARESMRIVELEVTPGAIREHAERIEVVLDGRGIRLLVSDGADTKYIAELAAELRARC